MRTVLSKGSIRKDREKVGRRKDTLFNWEDLEMVPATHNMGWLFNSRGEALYPIQLGINNTCCITHAA